MNDTERAIIAAIIRGGLKLWGARLGKPEGWIPSSEEIAEIVLLNEKTPEEFYREAAERLGVAWPPGQ